MPVDFRTLAFDTGRVVASARHVGGKIFPKLYAIENLLRSVIHSILTAQAPVGTTWWDALVDQPIKDKANRLRSRYAGKPRHSSPGRHGIYYLDLFDLNEIIRANASLFRPAIPDIDHWMVNIEQLRLPRNVVAHMNWLHQTDRSRIDVLHGDILRLVAHLQGSATITISCPPA